MATVDLQIENMHCGACVRRVSQTLNGLPETRANSVAVGNATITTGAETDRVLEALASAGFPAHITRNQP